MLFQQTLYKYGHVTDYVWTCNGVYTDLCKRGLKGE